MKAPIGESTHANPDSLKHTVASELVHLGRRIFKSRATKGKTAHNQVWLHFSGLLVGVRHEAAHKVRLAVVQLRTSSHAIKTIKAKVVEH